MELARVIGRVVCSVKNPSLVGIRLLVIQPQDHHGKNVGEAMVAADDLQAGPGDLISWVGGQEAGKALPKSFAPVDCAVVSIVDHVWGDEVYL